MKILLTNDDGIFAEGLTALRTELSRLEGLSLWVIAPESERSASGHAITIHKPLQVKKVEFDDAAPRDAWAVSGTPADCVKLALETILGFKPDLIISGINRGPNLGTDIFYSGTVSAAIEGAILGVPAIAVSVTTHECPDYTASAEFIFHLVKSVCGKNLPDHLLLNINIPALRMEQIAGVKITKLGVRKYKDVFHKRTDPRGGTYYWLAGDPLDVENGEGTDIAAIKNNQISITPICSDLTAHYLMEELEDLGITLP